MAWVDASDMEKSTAWTGDVTFGSGITFGKAPSTLDSLTPMVLGGLALLALLIYLKRKG